MADRNERGVEGGESVPKTILITGGGSGIGRAAALHLARSGDRVVVADVDEVRGKTVAEEIRSEGHLASSYGVDVSVAASVEDVVTRMLRDHDTIDALVHCAGVAATTSILEMTADEWRRVLSINLDGTFYVTQSVARSMVAQGRGAMVLMASDRGLYGGVGVGHYAAAKGGIIAYMKTLALELGPHGITVNAINPGPTDTPMAHATMSDDLWRRRMESDPLGKLSRPEEIAEIIAFLLGPAASFMTGQLVTTRMRFG